MMSVDDAVAMIAARVGAVPDTEMVALMEAAGRVLAEPIVAPLPLPEPASCFTAMMGRSLGSLAWQELAPSRWLSTSCHHSCEILVIVCRNRAMNGAKRGLIAER